MPCVLSMYKLNVFGISGYFHSAFTALKCISKVRNYCEVSLYWAVCLVRSGVAQQIPLAPQFGSNTILWDCCMLNRKISFGQNQCSIFCFPALFLLNLV